jgi:hypothetical protein
VHAVIAKRSRLSSVLRAALGATLAFSVVSVAACDKGGTSKREQSARANWIDSPKSGKTEGRIIKIPGLDVTFETPQTVYVYKNCEEADHSPDAQNKSWIPVVRCTSPFGEGGETDELSEESSGPIAITFYVTKNDAVINERAKESMRTQLQQAGFVVEEIEYYDEYLSKEKRRGIEVKMHTVGENGYPERYIQRFMFPRGDVMFIAHTDIPYNENRAGINKDWERILFFFQLDEDGPAYEGQGG